MKYLPLLPIVYGIISIAKNCALASISSSVFTAVFCLLVSAAIYGTVKRKEEIEREHLE